jgi:tRNA (guanine-N7-)-methyltransferase
MHASLDHQTGQVLSDIEVTYATLEPPISWEALFGNSAPVHVEIGFGKCGFLLAHAAERPDVNVLGIESARKYYRKGCRKVRRAGLGNLRLILGEALHLFQRYVPEASLQQVFVNFPDPWPKRRHAKRRLLQPAFADALWYALAPGGVVEIATDDTAYSQQIGAVFDRDQRYARRYYQTRQNQPPLRAHATEYERMFLEAGKTIHYYQYIRVV